MIGEHKYSNLHSKEEAQKTFNKFENYSEIWTVIKLRKKFNGLSEAEKNKIISIAKKYDSKYIKDGDRTGNNTWYFTNQRCFQISCNAFGQSTKRNTSDTIFFKTAGHAPYFVMVELSKKFPKVKLVLEYKLILRYGTKTNLVTFKNGKTIQH